MVSRLGLTAAAATGAAALTLALLRRRPAAALLRRLHATAGRGAATAEPAPQPDVLVLSGMPGLKAAFAARGLDVSSMAWAELRTAEDADAMHTNAEVIVAEPSPALARLLERGAPRARWVASTFAGCDALLACERKHELQVTRLAGVFGPDMAEYAALHVLALERRYEEHRARQAASEWASEGVRRTPYRRLSELTLGVLGLGSIGLDVARRLGPHGMGMRVLGFRRSASPEGGAYPPGDEARAAGVSEVHGPASLKAFLSSCDVVFGLLPHTAETAGLLDGDVLAACAARRPVLINAGRGSLVSEASVLRALEAGWLRHFVADVFAVEPLPPSSRLWTHERVTLTPHMAALTAAADVASCFEANLARYRRGEPLAHVWQPSRSY